MADDTERIIGALNENKEAVNNQLGIIVTKLDDHSERLTRVEGKVDDLNNVKKTIRTSLIRWFVPYVLAACGVGYGIVKTFGGG